jgi:hypothetical protein
MPKGVYVRTPETIKIYSEAQKRRKNRDNSHLLLQCRTFGFLGKKHSLETREKMSEHAGMKGKKHSEESKAKMRKARIKKIRELGSILSYNKDACEFFELYDLENNSSGQYAEKGGEYCIEELGFFLDYVNHETKMIIEYDEKHHYDRYGNLREKDVIRQNLIQEKFSEYKFLRVRA